MSSMNRRYFIIDIFNKATWNDSIKEVTDLLNDLFSDNEYKDYLDLIFSAISSFQLYGFLAYLSEEETQRFLELDFYRTNSYKGKKIDYYNKGQLSLLYDLDENKKVLFSAPTSFGKTSIIIDYILQNSSKLKNIVFIVPTNSLLEELYLKFLGYNKNLELGYNVTNQPNGLFGKNIFLLTPERFLLFIQTVKLSSIDLTVMDEMYKIADNPKKEIKDFINNRSLRFRRVADIIASSKNQVIFLSPFTYSVSNSMQKFITRFDIKKLNRRTEFVKRELLKATDFIGTVKEKNCEKVIRLLEHLSFEQNIVYVKGYNDGYQIVDSYNRDFYTDDNRYKAFCEHLNENYVIEESNWSIAEAISKGMGIYIAPMPRYIKKELVLLYEQGIINTMIVTTSFTEGVNTSAKNLIVTSLKNGGNTNDLTDIDVLNVMGRVGRFAKESIGKVYCLTDDIYDKVSTLQENGDCILENYNYVSEKHNIDYEIEMMDEKYLSQEEISKKEKLLYDMQEIGISSKDFQISLTVSNQWKLWLYQYFKTLNNQEIELRYDKLQVLLKEKVGVYEEALSDVFKDIRKAIENRGVRAFPVQPYDIPAFDRNGEFIWARLYKYYANGNIKSTIKNNIRYITGRYKSIIGENTYKKKRDLEFLFAEKGCTWILSYYTSGLELNYNKIYSECFRFISNVIQYKLPFYLTFYIAIFKLYLQKESLAEYELSKLEEKDIMLLFEDGGIVKEYQELMDYGIPMITLNKIRDRELSVNVLKEKYKEIEELDTYEKMMLKDCFSAI